MSKQTEEQDLGQEELGEGEERKPSLEEKITQLETTVQENAVVARLAADPEIRQLLEARQSGKKVKVVLEDEKPQTPPTEELETPPNLEEMTQSDLLRHMTKVMAATTEKVLKSRLAPFEQKLAAVEQSVQQDQRKEVQAQVDAARKSHKDFDQYKESMLSISQQNPGLGVEELYMLAKVRAGQPLVPDRSTESERPSRTSARPPKRQEPLPPGRSGFSALVGDALKRRVEDLDIG
jgi:hypothetical protein